MNISNEPGTVTLALRASDFDVAKKFYSELLDFVVDIDVWIGEGVIERPFRRLRMLLEPDARFAIEFLAYESVGDGAVQMPDLLPRLSFIVENFDEVLDQFQSRAKAAIVDCATLPYGSCLTVQDPFGNRLQIFST